MKKQIKKIKKNFLSMDKRLLKAQALVEELSNVSKKLKTLDKEMEVLQEFYHSDKWLDDRDLLYGEDNPEPVEEQILTAGEDSIWNTAQDYYLLRIKLLKQISKTL